MMTTKEIIARLNDGETIDSIAADFADLLNAANALGVDSCWIHRAREEFASEEGKALLEKWGLPAGLEGIGHCILGYRKTDLPEASPRKEGYVVRVK